MRREIVLIGPVRVGKTIVSKLLAERLNISNVSMDDVLLGYFIEVWFDENHWKLIAEKLGKPAAYRYLKVLGSYGVKRILEDNKDCVFDFGGGCNRSRRSRLAPFKHKKSRPLGGGSRILVSPRQQNQASLRRRRGERAL